MTGDLPALRQTLSGAIRLVFALTLPASFGLWALAGPLVQLLYQRGRFEALDTDRTAAALAAYCIGLCAYAAVKVLVPAFYALGDTRTPVFASFLSVVVNLVGNLLLMGPLGHVGLALSTSLAMLFNFAQLSFYMRRKLRRLDGRRMAQTLLRTALASAGMAAVVKVGVVLSESWWRAGTLHAGVVVAAGLALGVAATWVLYRSLRVEELPELEAALGGVARRLGWRAGVRAHARHRRRASLPAFVPFGSCPPRRGKPTPVNGFVVTLRLQTVRKKPQFSRMSGSRPATHLGDDSRPWISPASTQRSRNMSLTRRRAGWGPVKQAGLLRSRLPWWRAADS